MKSKRSNRAIATDITPETKKIVWERDNHRCVVCGNTYNVMPNAHYIPRRKGGLGIERNIVTLCTELTKNKCHRKFDFGTKQERAFYKEKIRNYLISKYPDWDESKLYFKNKWMK